MWRSMKTGTGEDKANLSSGLEGGFGPLPCHQETCAALILRAEAIPRYLDNGHGRFRVWPRP